MFVASSVVCVIGCKGPNAANIELRKQNQELRSKVEDLDRRHAADAAQIRSLESRATTVPVLPQDQLDKLFTVTGIKLGRLTGMNDGMLKVYAVPTDEAGHPLKAAGSFIVEAFDLSKPADRRVTRCEFPLSDAKKNWFGQAMLYEYVLPCPWLSQPVGKEITVKVTFTDALTGRDFSAQKVITLQSGQ